MPGCIIGDHCTIGQNVFIGERVQIGNRVKIQNNVSVYTGVTCSDDVFIGPSVVFTNVLNPRSFVDRKSEFKPTVLQQGASIGANSTLICGITVGKYAMIGAGSVVTKDVPAFALMYGNPAKQHGWVSRNGYKLNFANNQAVCPQTGEKYSLDNGRVSLTGNE
ncbi:N-acetyltransferase (plasmid) [Pedobacter sp. BS3]|nr:N-acetyltransferase [Pedobacter sp. BS3]